MVSNMKEPTILYEDKEVLVINKPAGLVVHGDGLPAQAGKTKERNLVTWILEKYPELKEVGEPSRTTTGEVIFRPGIVHRLDRDTSGVMIIAKTEESFKNLKEQFQQHEIKKIYHAFVYGEIKDKHGVIDRPIGRSNKDFRMYSAQRGSRGERRDAVTEYNVLNNVKGYAFVEVLPKTGRTHQIRVHFKAISHSLVADPLYASTTENDLGFERLALHSYEVTYKDIDGTHHTIKAPYPDDFIEAIKLLQSR